MTPAELNIYVRAYAERRREEQRIAEMNIYSLAALMRPMMWAKHPPNFNKAFPHHDKPIQQEMDDDQIYAMVRGFNAVFGGNEVQ